jgi:hypothetical protein
MEKKRHIPSSNRQMKFLWCLVLGIWSFLSSASTAAPAKTLQLSVADYQDRVRAIWTAQIAAVLMGFQFEHKVASTEWVDHYPKRYDCAPVDDDWYYEMCAVRGFEKYGIGMTVEQLGEQWKEYSCGSWGSSEQARLLLARGLKAPDTGHPRYNKLWFTIGPQFSADVYGALAPGRPNLAGKLARQFGHLNGYAEAVDGAVFVAGMVSLGFVERDTREIIRKAARLIHPDSPYRQCLDMIVSMAEAGKSVQEIADAIEDRWHIEYPATNNAVPNGGLVALGLWFGGGDFLKTVNIIYRSADFTDADCNAANAASVIAAMRGMKCLPANLVEPLNDRIAGSEMGGVKLTPAVDEKISDLARRTANVGLKLLAANGASVGTEHFSVPLEQPRTQPAELFALSDLTQYWNPDWKLERAGFGGAGGGIGGIRGITHLAGDVLATWPRDSVRGVVLRRTLKLGRRPSLSLQVAADPNRAWELEVYAGNKRMLHRLINGGAENSKDRKWENVQIDLAEFAGKALQLRLYQRVLLSEHIPGNAYWKNLKIE